MDKNNKKKSFLITPSQKHFCLNCIFLFFLQEKVSLRFLKVFEFINGVFLVFRSDYFGTDFYDSFIFSFTLAKIFFFWTKDKPKKAQKNNGYKINQNKTNAIIGVIIQHRNLIFNKIESKTEIIKIIFYNNIILNILISVVNVILILTHMLAKIKRHAKI